MVLFLLSRSSSRGDLAVCIYFAETPRKQSFERTEGDGRSLREQEADRDGFTLHLAKDTTRRSAGDRRRSLRPFDQIPNPVPEDSGYKPGMTPEQYFEYLCKTEAGSSSTRRWKTSRESCMMRPRKEATYEYNHLYALEDPYDWNEEATEPEMLFVRPSWYYISRNL